MHVRAFDAHVFSFDRLEVAAQRTLTKAPLAKKNAPVEEEEVVEEDGGKPASKKGKTFATGRKTDDNAGSKIGGM